MCERHIPEVARVMGHYRRRSG